MKRPDITNELVHFIRAPELGAAFRTLSTILEQRTLRGSAGYIRGGWACVCFSEAPVDFLGYAVSRNIGGRPSYQPLGIIVTKPWLFERGGRPVLYQPEAEYDLLPATLRWRHVRYEPLASPPVDFSWEREWRVQTSELRFTPEDVEVVVPTPEVAHWLQEDHRRREDDRELMHSLIFDQVTAWQLRGDFPWRLRHLRLDQVE